MKKVLVTIFSIISLAIMVMVCAFAVNRCVPLGEGTLIDSSTVKTDTLTGVASYDNYVLQDTIKYTDVDSFLVLQSHSSSKYDDYITFLTMPRPILCQVSKVCIKKYGYVSPQTAVNEYMYAREFYDNLVLEDDYGSSALNQAESGTPPDIPITEYSKLDTSQVHQSINN